MPSQKTAEKPVEMIEITAVRKFAVEYTLAELKAMQSGDKERRSHTGLTKMIEIGESAEVTKEVAKKLTNAGAAKVKL